MIEWRNVPFQDELEDEDKFIKFSLASYRNCDGTFPRALSLDLATRRFGIELARFEQLPKEVLLLVIEQYHRILVQEERKAVEQAEDDEDETSDTDMDFDIDFDDGEGDSQKDNKDRFFDPGGLYTLLGLVRLSIVSKALLKVSTLYSMSEPEAPCYSYIRHIPYVPRLLISCPWGCAKYVFLGGKHSEKKGWRMIVIDPESSRRTFLRCPGHKQGDMLVGIADRETAKSVVGKWALPAMWGSKACRGELVRTPSGFYRGFLY
ncbi:MAG: hypothetical protein Q9227_006159 [Pyrenula ochraceoflavens]